MSTQTNPKIHFLLGFRPLYFENVGACKIFTRVKKKVAEMRGISSPVPPAFGAHACLASFLANDVCTRLGIWQRKAAWGTLWWSEVVF